MSKASATLKSRVVEIVSGLAMVIVGVGVTAVSSGGEGPNTLGIAAGGLLTALGGVLLSWVAALAFSKKDATEELNQQLDAVSRNLGHAATRVTRAVEQCQAQELDSTAGLALISQATTMIYGQIDQIQRLIGAKFDSDELSLTLSELDKLADKLDRQPSASSADVRQEVARILATARGGARGRTAVEVQCPYCSVRSPGTLGSESGATARLKCPSCEGVFNAHRASDGSAFTRALRSAGQGSSLQDRQLSKGSSSGPRSPDGNTDGTAPFTFACSACTTLLTHNGAAQDDNPRLMVCTRCFTSHFVNLQSQQVAPGDKYECSAGSIVGRRGSQPFVPCPKCNRVIRAALNNGISRFALCTLDQQIIEVTHEDFERWRARDGATAATMSEVLRTDWTWRGDQPES